MRWSVLITAQVGQALNAITPKFTFATSPLDLDELTLKLHENSIVDREGAVAYVHCSFLARMYCLVSKG